MIRKISLILTVVLLFTCLAACGEEVIVNREYNKNEVIAAAKTLIKKSESLNTLLWGEGIKYDPLNAPDSSGYYYRADEFSLSSYGIETVEDIENLVRDAFSEGYSNDVIASSVFTSAKDSTGNLVYFARYQQKGEVGSPEYILVYSKWEPFLFDAVTYDYSTIRDTGAVGEQVFVEIDCTVTDSETEKSEKRTVKVALIEEKDGWKIDSPTYCEINPEKE